MSPDIEEARPSPSPTDRVDNEVKYEPELPSLDAGNDPTHPQNWPKSLKWTSTIIISAFTFDTMMTSNMVAPALYNIAEDLHVSNEATMQLILSSYVLSYAFGPLLWAPLSELYGRVVILQVASTSFFLWNMLCGFAGTQSLLIVGRVFSGMGASAALAISSGVLADCWRPEQRGRSLAVYTFIPMLGPTIGPIIGGVIVQNSTWRWSFWSTSAFDAVLQGLALLLLRETHYATLLRRKARTVRQVPSHQAYNAPSTKSKLHSALRRPFHLLVTQVIILLLALFSAISFGTVYLVLSILPTLFTTKYHQSISISALNYVSYGIGAAIGAQSLAISTDCTYRRKARSVSAKPEPELRVTLLLPSIIISALGLICLGWSAEFHTQWIVPNIGIAIFGAGTQFSTQCINAYVIDVYGPIGWSASAMAGIWASRSVAGFGFPVFAPWLVRAFGWGWGMSVLAAGLMAVGGPVSLGVVSFGGVFRRRGKKKLQM